MNILLPMKVYLQTMMSFTFAILPMALDGFYPFRMLRKNSPPIITHVAIASSRPPSWSRRANALSQVDYSVATRVTHFVSKSFWNVSSIIRVASSF